MKEDIDSLWHKLSEEVMTLVAARRDLTLAMLRWKTNYRTHQLEYYVDHDETVVIIDRRGAEEKRERLSALQSRIFLYLDQSHPFSVIAKTFPEIDSAPLRAFLERMVSSRYVYRHKNDHYLSVAVRLYTEGEYFRELENYSVTLKHPGSIGDRNPRKLTVLTQLQA